MRIDDVVIVEGEWGTIEEITLTYVVVRVWDQRRLVVPITYFLEKSFQNWTRNSSDLIGTVFFYADFLIPIDEIRAEAQRIVHASKLWDKRVFVVQVTDFKSDSVEIRILAEWKPHRRYLIFVVKFAKRFFFSFRRGIPVPFRAFGRRFRGCRPKTPALKGEPKERSVNAIASCLRTDIPNAELVR
jgi:small-conductance mechanosensitive channel